MAEKTQSTPAKAKTAFRRKKALRLGRLSGGLLDKSIRRQGFVETRIVADWPEIAGPELARVTVPLKVRFPRGKRSGATLFLRCSSAFAPLAQHQSPRIIESVNRYFGYPAVENLSISQGPIRQVRGGARPVLAIGQEDKRQATAHLEAIGASEKGLNSDLGKALVSLRSALSAKARDKG